MIYQSCCFALFDAKTVRKDISRSAYQDDFRKYRPRQNAAPSWAKDMESSRRYLLQAEIEYWHEMLRLNRSRVSKNREEEMRRCLKQAVRLLNSNSVTDYRIAA